ncbi:Peptide chain release factor 2 [Serratia symbiotica]|nr:Peptide chain release factor 2 [Serratia symbiotica]
MFDINKIKNQIKKLSKKISILIKILNYNTKIEDLKKINTKLKEPNIWNTPNYAQKLGKKRAILETIISTINKLLQDKKDINDLFELVLEEKNIEFFNEINIKIHQLTIQLKQLEFQNMFSGKYDNSNCYLDIKSGSGGIESQDWTNMLLRMYLKWAETKNFKITIIEESNGDIIGLKSITIKITGNYVFGWLKNETGIHRLVRKSPFDSNKRRHTSFSSVFIYPEINDNINIKINPIDLRIDVYRSSGAGGQHVNKTESAVRITHLPTNTVVQCQNNRSQHKNKEHALKQLYAKLYELNIQKKNLNKKIIEDNKSDICWGNQIRSYILDDSRIKDLRTNLETNNIQEVLNGNIDEFLIANLKYNL